MSRVNGGHEKAKFGGGSLNLTKFWSCFQNFAKYNNKLFGTSCGVFVGGGGVGIFEEK